MDAFELLKQDHKKVSKLFAQIESAKGAAKTSLFNQLKAELDLHAHIEETVLYPALENTDEAREITLEAYEEHKVVKDLLGELANAGTPNDEWDAKLTVLKENVEHHVEEEEGELFGKARKALGQERIEELGAELEAEKAKQSGIAPKPQQSGKAAKAPAKKSAKTETPGVLKRLANLVGLGETSSSDSSAESGNPGTSGRKAPAESASKSKSASTSGGKAGASSSASRAKTAKPAAKSATKSANKGAAKKGAAKKNATKSRSSTKATAGKKKSASSGARSSATKSAARGASNQKVSGRKRPAAKAGKSAAKARKK
jgi:iron-sulfur cluster repair protein YtfE (RIC family)